MAGGNGGESVQHLTGKLRLKNILEQKGWSVSLEFKLPAIEVPDVFPTVQKIEYIADVLAVKADSTLVLEVDGNVGHTTTQAKAQDDFRDSQLWEKYGLMTGRLPTEWLVNKSAKQETASDDEGVIEEIEFQCKKKYNRAIKI